MLAARPRTFGRRRRSGNRAAGRPLEQRPQKPHDRKIGMIIANRISGTSARLATTAGPSTRRGRRRCRPAMIAQRSAQAQAQLPPAQPRKVGQRQHEPCPPESPRPGAGPARRAMITQAKRQAQAAQHQRSRRWAAASAASRARRATPASPERSRSAARRWRSVQRAVRTPIPPDPEAISPAWVKRPTARRHRPGTRRGRGLVDDLRTGSIRATAGAGFRKIPRLARRQPPAQRRKHSSAASARAKGRHQPGGHRHWRAGASASAPSATCLTKSTKRTARPSGRSGPHA